MGFSLNPNILRPNINGTARAAKDAIMTSLSNHHERHVAGNSAVFLVAAVLAGAVTPALAKTIAIECAPQAISAGSSIILTYEGEDTGKLVAKGSFGEMNLAARAEERQIPDIEGKTLQATVINAWGPADIALPGLADVEACVMGKLPSDQLNDSDFKEVMAAGCILALPAGGARVSIDAAFEILVDSAGPGAFYSVSYAAKSALGDNIVKIASYPLTNCKAAP
jgi:hypothetical protein